MKSWFRVFRLLPLACVLITVLLTFQSARMGLSGLIVELAQSEVDRWPSARGRVPMSELHRIGNYFSDSLSVAPNNPWALESLGSLDLLSVRASRTPSEAVDFARKAHSQYSSALKERPSSPFLWANLALAKLYLDQIDDIFFSALRHADELGPWEPSTQQVVLFVSLAAWQKLNEDQRQAVRRAVERGGVRNAAKMFEIVKTYRRFDLVCGLSAYHAVGGKACGEAPGAPPKPAQKGKP